MIHRTDIGERVEFVWQKTAEVAKSYFVFVWQKTAEVEKYYLLHSVDNKRQSRKHRGATRQNDNARCVTEIEFSFKFMVWSWDVCLRTKVQVLLAYAASLHMAFSCVADYMEHCSQGLTEFVGCYMTEFRLRVAHPEQGTW